MREFAIVVFVLIAVAAIVACTQESANRRAFCRQIRDTGVCDAAVDHPTPEDAAYFCGECGIKARP